MPWLLWEEQRNIMNNSKFLEKRYKADRRLKKIGISAITAACLFLAIILISIILEASSVFTIYKMQVELPNNPITSINEAENFLKNKTDKFSALSKMSAEIIVQDQLSGKVWLPVSAKINDILINTSEILNPKIAENLQLWQQQNLIKKSFDFGFFINKESRNPEMAGILTSWMGSLYTMLVCILVAIPISICTAIYLEEFAPRNLITSLIEVNINNLAAVPSIVFGLLALAILINFFDLPRSTPITAGLTLAMMSLPTLVITARSAMRTVPTAIKHAALALGATRIQVIFHYTLPLALPGIATGIILSIARAMGETAPLILVGMVAFIVDVPHSIFDPATVLPVQIYLWSSSPEHAFKVKTAAAIVFLLTLLILVNMVAVYIRKKFEHRW